MLSHPILRCACILAVPALFATMPARAIVIIDDVPRFSAQVTEPTLSNLLVDAERTLGANDYAGAARLYHDALGCTVPAARIALDLPCDDVPLALRLTSLRLLCLGKSSWYKNSAISNEAHAALLRYADAARGKAWRDYMMLSYHLARYYSGMRDLTNLVSVNAARIAYHPDIYALHGLVYLDEKNACGAPILASLLASYFAHGGASNAYAAYLHARVNLLRGDLPGTQTLILDALATWPTADELILRKLIDMGSAHIAGADDPWLPKYRAALATLALRQSSTEARIGITAFIISEITKLRTVLDTVRAPAQAQDAP